MTYSVYMHTCKSSGKSYVGYTSRGVNARWLQHVATARRGKRRDPLHKAITLHGADDFDTVTLGEFGTAEEALAYEVEMIELHDTMGHRGYNAHEGGSSGYAGMSAEAKAKHKASIRKAFEAVEYRARLSESVKASYDNNPELRLARSKRSRDSFSDPEFRKKHAEGVAKRDQSAEYRERRAEMFASADYKARHREACSDPMHRARISASLREAKDGARPQPLTPVRRHKLRRDLQEAAANNSPATWIADLWRGRVGRKEFAELCEEAGYKYRTAYLAMGKAQRKARYGQSDRQRLAGSSA